MRRSVVRWLMVCVFGSTVLLGHAYQSGRADIPAVHQQSNTDPGDGSGGGG